MIQEILDQDLLDKIESPPVAPPDLRTPVVFKEYFEKANRHLGLYYTKDIMT